MSQTTCSPRPPKDDNDFDDGIPAKRRKVRKGTRSCWECRQRKMKCTFNQPTDNTCTRCHRRGIKCVSQEYPEEITSSLERNIHMGDRMARVEKLLDKLLGQESPASHKTDHRPKEATREQNNKLVSSVYGSEDSLTTALLKPLARPESSGFEIIDGYARPSRPEPPQEPRTLPAKNTKYEQLSRVLHAFLPTLEDTKTIVKACGNTSSLFYQMHIVPYDNLDEGKSLETMFARPDPTAHPVIVAKHMLNIATALQHLHPDFVNDVDGLSETPREMMRRLAMLSINAVTTNDDLVNCIEGLDCMLVESWYHTNGGNLRKGLVTVRRAMTIAQLMGLHRPRRANYKCIDRQTKAYPEFIWFRINSLERYLCLMLGLPQATLDNSMASKANLSNDTPMGRLDRIHCVVTSKILERNQSTLNVHDFSLTRALDEELQKASRILPAKWWLTPNLATVSDRPQALFWDMRRLFHHLFHHNLLIQLHLPWMLHSALSGSGQDYQYSQTICINSAREILSRFSMFHSFNRIAFSCRTVDFFGLMAATTLLAAHIDGHRRLFSVESPQEYSGIAINPLAHQRLSDRALVEGIQEIMSEVSRVENDTMSVQLSNILQRLMSIEAEADTLASDPEERSLLSHNEDSVQLSIPYFGAIEITSRGIVSHDAKRAQAKPAVATKGQIQSTSGAPSDMIGLHADDHLQGNNSSVDSMSNRNSLVSGTMGPSQLSQEPDELQVDCSGISDADDTANPGDGISSSKDSGVLSDIDMAFFDTLMGGTGNEESDGIDWLAWLNDFQLPDSSSHAGI